MFELSSIPPFFDALNKNARRNPSGIYVNPAGMKLLYIENIIKMTVFPIIPNPGSGEIIIKIKEFHHPKPR